MNTPETDHLLSRRRFLAGSAVALGSVAAASATSSASASPLLKASHRMRSSRFQLRDLERRQLHQQPQELLFSTR